ncbi:hypothetical protein CSCA_1826 [Clostridium scatologenes]|uniref:Uncharacterized protein n=1 Tax=Clostridium scatologenes TaxID=1548 RepID=A0A0E3GQP9_CLOSL|nr:hypothetical protein CSCA_1826 [Clostridium scatologenes]
MFILEVLVLSAANAIVEIPNIKDAVKTDIIVFSFLNPLSVPLI